MTDRQSRGTGKTPLFNMRMPLALRAQLEAAARASGQTLTGEIVGRLERSLREEGKIESRFGRVETYRIMILISEVIRRVEEQHDGASWLLDADVFDSAITTISLLLDDLRPRQGEGSRKRVSSTVLANIAQSVWTDVANSQQTRLDRLAPIKHDLGHITSTRWLFEHEFDQRVMAMVNAKQPSRDLAAGWEAQAKWFAERARLMDECSGAVRAEMIAEGKIVEEPTDGKGP